MAWSVLEETVDDRHQEPCVGLVQRDGEDGLFDVADEDARIALRVRLVIDRAVEVVPVDHDGLFSLLVSHPVFGDDETADVDRGAVRDPVDQAVCDFPEHDVVHRPADGLEFCLDALICADSVCGIAGTLELVPGSVVSGEDEVIFERLAEV